MRIRKISSKKPNNVYEWMSRKQRLVGSEGMFRGSKFQVEENKLKWALGFN